METQPSLRYVEDLQDDARVLLGYLAAEGRRRLADGLPVGATGVFSPNAEGSAPETTFSDFLATVAASPENVAVSADQLTKLTTLVDRLSAMAMPASARTIRITNAYMQWKWSSHILKWPKDEGENNVSPTPPVVSGSYSAQVRSLKIVFFILKLSCILFLAVGLYFFAVAEIGRQAMGQLAGARAEISSIRDRLQALPPAAWVRINTGEAANASPGATIAPSGPDPSTPTPPAPTSSGGSPGTGPARAAAQASSGAMFRDFCPREPSDIEKFLSGRAPSPPIRRFPADTQEGAQAFQLCNQLFEAKLREDLIFVRLANLNCLTYNMWNLFARESCDQVRNISLRETMLIPEISAGCPPGSVFPTFPCDSVVNNRHWSRTEIRTSGTVYLIATFVLPVVMGALGGFAFVFRRVSQKMQESALDVRDGSQSVLRVLMAMLLGGLIGVLFNGGQPITLGGLSMTLAAVAFFVGFSVEPVFSFVERLVASTLAITGTPPTPPAKP